MTELVNRFLSLATDLILPGCGLVEWRCEDKLARAKVLDLALQCTRLRVLRVPVTQLASGVQNAHACAVLARVVRNNATTLRVIDNAGNGALAVTRAAAACARLERLSDWGSEHASGLENALACQALLAACPRLRGIEVPLLPASALLDTFAPSE